MNNKHDNANQRGSALLLTLGVLSLALILAMAFAFSSRSSRLIAKVNADMIKAKLLAQSGLTRLMAAMYHDTNDTPGFYIARKANNLPFTGTITASNASVGFLSMGTDTSAESENNLINTLKRNCDYVDTLSVIVESFLPTGFQTITSDGKIIGRIGFIVLEESGKIDLNQTVILRTTGNNMPFIEDGAYRINDGTANFVNTDGDFYYNIIGDYKPATQVDETNTLRMGLHMQEIQVAAPYFSALPATSGANVANKRAQWMSYDHLLNSLQYTEPDKTTFNTDILRYTFFSGEEPEAYFDKTFPDTDFQRERQRFDITGYEWRDSTLGSYYSGSHPNPAATSWQHPTAAEGSVEAADYARDLVAALQKPSQPFWEKVTPVTDPPTYKLKDVNRIVASATSADFTDFSGIPWLSTLTPATARSQVAANLVDYCDSDSWATVPDTVTWASTTEPAYCGNEKVPYFNEVALEVVASYIIIDNDPAPDTYSYELRIVPSVELVNIFEDDLPCEDYRLKMTVSYTLTNNDGSVEYAKEDDKVLEFDFDKPDNILKMDYGRNSPDLTTEDATTLVHKLDHALTTPITGAKYNLTISKVILIAGTLVLPPNPPNNDPIADFAFWQGSTTISIEPESTSLSKYTSIEVADPRVNHLSASWTWRAIAAVEENSNTLDKNKNNTVFIPNSSGFDPEDVDFFATPPRTFSTAFIRNAPMESLWELGAIHRGAPWQTLNLKSFATTGDYDYADGDAMILDQVKIGPVKFSRGKYNPNAINPAVFNELLFGINPANPYDAPTWGGAGPLPDKDDWHSPSEFRGQAANLFATLGGTTDRAREAWIGRTANLLSTRNDCYTIIVLAQALQELPADINTPERFEAIKASVINPTVYNVSGTNRYCSILATQVLMAHVVRDAWRNTYKIVQQRYLE